MLPGSVSRMPRVGAGKGRRIRRHPKLTREGNGSLHSRHLRPPLIDGRRGMIACYQGQWSPPRRQASTRTHSHSRDMHRKVPGPRRLIGSCCRMLVMEAMVDRRTHPLRLEMHAGNGSARQPRCSLRRRGDRSAQTAQRANHKCERAECGRDAVRGRCADVAAAGRSQRMANAHSAGKSVARSGGPRNAFLHCVRNHEAVRVWCA